MFMKAAFLLILILSLGILSTFCFSCFYAIANIKYYDEVNIFVNQIQLLSNLPKNNGCSI